MPQPQKASHCRVLPVRRFRMCFRIYRLYLPALFLFLLLYERSFCAKFLSHTAKRFFFTALSLLCKLLALSGNRNYHTVIIAAQNGIIQYLQKLIELQMRVSSILLNSILPILLFPKSSRKSEPLILSSLSLRRNTPAVISPLSSSNLLISSGFTLSGISTEETYSLSFVPD